MSHGGGSADNTDCDDNPRMGSSRRHGVAPRCGRGLTGLKDDDDAVIDTTTYTTWYADPTPMATGISPMRGSARVAPAGTVADNTDCDDTDGDIKPDGTEICDGVDNDCDLPTSENAPVRRTAPARCRT